MSKYVPDVYLFTPKTDAMVEHLDEWSRGQSQTPDGTMYVKCYISPSLIVTIRARKISAREYHFKGDLRAVSAWMREMVRDLPAEVRAGTSLKRLRRNA